MGYSITVNSDNFETEVFQKSFEKPVLIDFFAVWCGPCQMLKPLLEKLALEYDLVVAKVNTDENRQLAHDYGIEGIPDVRLMKQGEMLDGFVGVLTESQIREFLAHHNILSQIDETWQLISANLSQGKLVEAEEKLNLFLTQYPDNRQLTLDASKIFINQLNRLETAEQLLTSIQEFEKEYFPQAQALKQLIFLKRECDRPSGESELDRLFSRAACLTLKEDYEAALEAFLEIVKEDRSYKNDGARKAMLAIFDLLGADRPLTKNYRKQLMMALY